MRANIMGIIYLCYALQARVSDGNAKVAVQALEVLGRAFETLRERVVVGLNTLVPALAANLGSSNDKIRVVANQATDQLIASVDPAMLVQVRVDYFVR